MSTYVIVSVLMFSTFIPSIFSLNYQNIGDCYHYDADYAGSCNLTLICVENAQENNFFEPSTVSVCPLSSNNFEKYWIGTLNFQNCEWSEIPNHPIFEIYYNVHTFNVSHLGLTALHPENFVQSNNMTKLIASHNKIVNISSNLFCDSLDLSVVDLSFNGITQIDPDAFSPDNHVLILNLVFNRISELSIDFFKKLRELKYLHLTHNQIVKIPPFLFHSSPNLVEVDFSFNQIGKIEDFAFFGDVSLEKLNLSHNQITEFHKQIVENHSDLKDLDISWNKITEIKTDTFKNLQNLVLLDLSGNSLNGINNTTFFTLIKLQQLNLSRTSLSEVQPGTFSHQINLQTLDLSTNNIKTLNSNILPAQLNQLKWLFIENNQLREMNGFTSASFTKIIGVASSKFECSFLDKGTEIITWFRLETVSRPMKCIFHNESTDNDGKGNAHDRINEALVEVEDVKVENINDAENEEYKDVKNHNVARSDVPRNEHKTNSMNQLLLITWINTVGLIIIAVALIWMVLRGRLLKQDNFTSISYRKNDIVLLEGNECSS